jgi:hypothetical protein
VWRIEGIGRVRIDSMRWGTVRFCRPDRAQDADPLFDSHWREGTIAIALEEFDKLATLEHR